MNRRNCLLFAAALLVATPTLALEPPDSGSGLSKQEAAKRAQQKLGGGKVLGVKLRDGKSSKPYFDVKLLDGGKVKVLRIEAD